MKILILCLLTARTCLGQGEQYNDTITEFLEKNPTITIANDEALAIAKKNLDAHEAQVNAQNEKYAKGEASYRQILSIPEQKKPSQFKRFWIDKTCSCPFVRYINFLLIQNRFFSQLKK